MVFMDGLMVLHEWMVFMAKIYGWFQQFYPRGQQAEKDRYFEKKIELNKIWQRSSRHHASPIETVQHTCIMTLKGHLQNLTSGQGQVMLYISRHGLKR